MHGFEGVLVTAGGVSLVVIYALFLKFAPRKPSPPPAPPSSRPE